jgi:hypothetical protein
MSNYSTARWSAFQYALDQMMAKPEFAYKPSPTLQKYLKNTGFLISASEKERILGVKQSDQDTVQVNLLNKQATTAATARAAAHTGNINDSTLTTATFSTKAAKFKYSIKGSDRTIWTLADQVAAQVRSACIDLHGVIETALLATLNTSKSQEVVSLTPKSGLWDATNFIFQVYNADSDLFLQKIKGFMREQYLRGGVYDVIFDEGLYQKAESIIAQGAGNSTNLAWQGMGIDALVSQELTVDENYSGMGYIFEPGSIGILPWIPKLNRTPGGFGDTYASGGFYYSIPDPLGSGLTFAVHEYATAADNASNAGETQDIDIQVEISVDYAPIIPTLSTANKSGVYKFGVVGANPSN